MQVCIEHRKKNDKQNHDNTNDKELTVMIIDNNETYYIKDNLSWLTPGTPTRGACPNCKPFRTGAISNSDFLLSTTRRHAAITSGWPLRMGFTNAGYDHGSHYEKVPFSFGNLLRAKDPRTVWFIHRFPQTPPAVGLKAIILSQP